MGVAAASGAAGTSITFTTTTIDIIITTAVTTINRFPSNIQNQ